MPRKIKRRTPALGRGARVGEAGSWYHIAGLLYGHDPHPDHSRDNPAPYRPGEARPCNVVRDRHSRRPDSHDHHALAGGGLAAVK